jgi:hypothetical protein
MASRSALGHLAVTRWRRSLTVNVEPGFITPSTSLERPGVANATALSSTTPFLPSLRQRNRRLPYRQALGVSRAFQTEIRAKVVGKKRYCLLRVEVDPDLLMRRLLSGNLVVRLGPYEHGTVGRLIVEIVADIRCLTHGMMERVERWIFRRDRARQAWRRPINGRGRTQAKASDEDERREDKLHGCFSGFSSRSVRLTSLAVPRG